MVSVHPSDQGEAKKMVENDVKAVEADLTRMGTLHVGEVAVVNDRKLLSKIDCRLMPIL